MSERTAVLDLAGNAAVPEAHTKINVEPGGSTTARPATDDVLVVERCFGRHNEQVCVRICLRVCALAGASSIFHLRQATQPGWPCVRPPFGLDYLSTVEVGKLGVHFEWTPTPRSGKRLVSASLQHCSAVNDGRASAP